MRGVYDMLRPLCRRMFMNLININYHNRIELYFYEKESIKVIEILKDELSGVIIGKELFKSNI